MSKNLLIKNANQLVTVHGYKAKFGLEMNDIGLIENGSVYVKDGIIEFVGKTEDVILRINDEDFNVIDASNKVVLPGFIDSHTHFVFGGYRDSEYSMRLKGATYVEIMNNGGGIVNTVNNTRKESIEILKNEAKKRLNKMIEMGVTTIEGKSGYGLDYETELKQLEVMKQLNDEHYIDIVSTFLGAHDIPKEFKDDEMGYIDFIIEKVLPIVKEKGLAEFCDIFTEKNVFSIEGTRKLLTFAKSLGFKLKLHADEIVEKFGGAELAGELKAVSADHLLKISDAGIDAMKENSVICNLLPATAFSLKEDFAPGRKMIDSGCAVAVASDLNPGSCFTQSIPLLIALSTIYMKLTPEETITALTLNAAASIGKEKNIGSISQGKNGDLIILEYPTYDFLAYNFGMNIVEKVIKNGELIFDKERGV